MWKKIEKGLKDFFLIYKRTIEMPNTMKLIDVFAQEYGDIVLFNTVISSCPKDKQVAQFDSVTIDNHQLHIKLLEYFINNGLQLGAEVFHHHSIPLKDMKSTEEEIFIIAFPIKKAQINNEKISSVANFGIYKDFVVDRLPTGFPRQKPTKIAKKTINNLKNKLHIVLTKAIKLLSIKLHVERSTITSHSIQDVYSIPSSIQYHTTVVEKHLPIKCSTITIQPTSIQDVSSIPSSIHCDTVVDKKIQISEKTHCVKLYKILELYNVERYRNEPKILELYNVERYRKELFNVERYRNEPKNGLFNFERYRDLP